MPAVDNLRDKWESISPRERRLVVLLGVSAVVVAVLYVALAIKDRLDALEAKNNAARSALHKLTAHRATARTIAAGDPAVEIPTEPAKLDTYIYNAGKTAKVTVPGVNPRTPTPKGKYTVYSASVDIRDLSLVQVKDFLQALETDSRVVVVTNLRLTRNFRDQEKMDLSAEIATYAKGADAGAGSGTGAGTGTAAKAGGG